MASLVLMMFGLLLLASSVLYPKSNGPIPEATSAASEELVDKLESIQKVLSERLSGKDTVQQGFRNVIESIEDLKRVILRPKPLTYVQKPTWNSWIDIPFILSFVFIVLCLVIIYRAYIIHYTKNKKFIYAVLGVLISLGGGTIFGNLINLQIESFFRFDKSNEVIGVPAETMINIEKVAIEWPLDATDIYHILFEKLPSSGPFKTGEENLVSCHEVHKLEEKLKDRQAEKYTLSLMIIAGKVDKRPLKHEKKNIYGSNLGLAQRRAAWVRSCILLNKELQLDKDKIIVVATGPEHVGKQIKEKDLERDRIVLAYAFWQRAK